MPWLAPVTMATDLSACVLPDCEVRARMRASPVPLPESRRRLHRAPYTSDCGLRGAPESSRPSAPPYSAASPAQSCDPLPLTETTMASFSTPARELSLECISPRSAAARLRESWSGPVKPCERLRGQNPLRASRSAHAHPARDAAPPDAAWRDKKHLQRSHPQRAPAPPRTRATLPGHPSRRRSQRPHRRVPPAATGPLVLSITRWRAAMSSVSDVSGIGAHVTLRPSFRNGRMTFCQQEPSAHAPWTNTTVAF